MITSFTYKGKTWHWDSVNRYFYRIYTENYKKDRVAVINLVKEGSRLYNQLRKASKYL